MHEQYGVECLVYAQWMAMEPPGMPTVVPEEGAGSCKCVKGGGGFDGLLKKKLLGGGEGPL